MRDVGLAEELAQDALVAALEQWPESGIPDKPGAWLMGTAKHRAIDLLRRRKRLELKYEEMGHELLGTQHEISEREFEAVIDDDVGDDLLRLIFTACHPVLSTEARVALTLRLLGGLTTEEIARAFLVSEPAVAQRIVRAKRALSEAHVPFEVPQGAELAARLSSVLEVIYLIFNEGYTATVGNDWLRPALCEDALRLGRILAELTPREAEVHGLVALMEIQASRTRARVGRTGDPVLLLDQDRGRWDQVLIRRGLAALQRAEQLGGGRGPYALQAAIAACHARARTAPETDWARIAALYAALARLAPSPVVELNRAVAVGMAFGPAAGLELVDALTSEPALANYQYLPSVRGDLLAKLARFDDARTEFERAAVLTRNARERRLLLERAATYAREVLPQPDPLPGDLPVPADDGAARHLAGRKLPRLALQATDGNPVPLDRVTAGRWVLFVYPSTGRPGAGIPQGWNEIPGARGCSQEACGFRDNLAALKADGAARVFALSTDPSEYQQDLVRRLQLPYPMLSDPMRSLGRELDLPSFEANGLTLYKRLTMIVRGDAIEHVFYPIFPPNTHASEVLDWLRRNPSPHV